MKCIPFLFIILLSYIDLNYSSQLNDAYQPYQPPSDSNLVPDKEEARPIDVVITYPKQTLFDAQAGITRFIENCEPKNFQDLLL